MKSELTLLIEHTQAEIDHLKSLMDQCIVEYDFKRAKAIKGPLMYTQKNLNVLKNLENPNHNKITRLTNMIGRMEQSLNEKQFGMDDMDESTRQTMLEFIHESNRRKMDNYKIEIDSLQLSSQKPQADSDKIYELLEKLESNEINQITFEIKRETVFLILIVDGDQAQLSFKTIESTKLEDFLVKPTKIILANLGYDAVTFKKRILNFKTLDKSKFLEEMALIYFEIFDVYGETLNVKID